MSNWNNHTGRKRDNSLEHQLDCALKGLVRWKCRYRGIRKFLLAKGVPQEYFDEYNKQFGEHENKSKV